MRRFSIIGLALMAVLAFSVVAASSASALPQFYHCSKVDTNALSGPYPTEKNCEELKNVGSGEWWWSEFSGAEKLSFTDSGNVTKFHSALVQVQCEKNTSTGEITSGMGSMLASKIVIQYEKCHIEGKPTERCGNEPGAASETIKTKALMGTLGYATNPQDAKHVGMMIEAEAGTLATFNCEKVANPIEVLGKVIGLFPEVEINTMLKAFTLNFECENGGLGHNEKQKDQGLWLLGSPEKFEGTLHLEGKIGVLKGEACQEGPETITLDGEGEIMA